MLEFILYEENVNYINITKKIIEKMMMKTDIEYIVTVLEKDNWQLKINENNFKIYILNIKTRKNSGLDIARYIRTNNDWQSMIIVTSETLSFTEEVFTSRLLLIDYIQKGNPNYEKRLEDAITIGIRNYECRPKSLKYSYRNIYYNIEFSKIVFIEKEIDSKRCIINTNKNKFYILGNLSQIEKKLDKRFLKCNRSYIINTEQVEQYDTKKNIITFKNGYTINSISREKKKIIINYFRGL